MVKVDIINKKVDTRSANIIFILGLVSFGLPLLLVSIGLIKSVLYTTPVEISGLIYIIFISSITCGLINVILGINYCINGNVKTWRVVVGMIISLLVLSLTVFEISMAIKSHNLYTPTRTNDCIMDNGSTLRESICEDY